MMAYQHHTRLQKGSNIRKIVSTRSSRSRGTLTHAHHQQAEVRRKWEGQSPRPPIRIRTDLLVSLSLEESTFEGLGEAFRKIKLTYHWESSYLWVLNLDCLVQNMEGILAWGWGLEIGGPGWFFAVKNAALLIQPLPNHILLNRLMRDFTKQTDAMLLLTMPLNLPSIIMTDIVTIRVLGLFVGS